MIQYLLDNDIIIFLCEAMSSLDWNVFRCVLNCMRLIWREKRFFVEEHGAHAAATVLRTLTHYATCGMNVAVDACLHFLCDLFTGLRVNAISSPLSYDSAYGVEQFLACLSSLKESIVKGKRTVLAVALVFHSLVSHQPENLRMRADTARAVAKTVEEWSPILVDSLKHAALVGVDNNSADMFYIVICQIGVDLMRLCKLLEGTRPRSDFVQTILASEQEDVDLIRSSNTMIKSLHDTLLELVIFTKENHRQLQTEEYGMFLKFVYYFLSENTHIDLLSDFCDVLCINGYLSLLPQVYFDRNNETIRKISTLVLGEILVNLSRKYLQTDDHSQSYSTDIKNGLVELQCVMEQPQSIGSRLLQKPRPYSVLVFLYFYCQYTENPQEATTPLLPYLVQYLTRTSKAHHELPKYIVKALWLVYAMASLSMPDDANLSIEDKILGDKCTERLMDLLKPNPTLYYTHHPAILFWVLTTKRLSNKLGSCVLSCWLEIEDTVPAELIPHPALKHLIVTILENCDSRRILSHAARVIQLCLKKLNAEENQHFTKHLWAIVPNVLAKRTDTNFDSDRNCRYLLELVAGLNPTSLDATICARTAHLVCGLFSMSSIDNYTDSDDRLHFEYVCLKLSLVLLELARMQQDIRVLRIYSNNVEFLRCVLASTQSARAQVACAALQMLSHLVYYCNRMQYKPGKRLEMDTVTIVKALRAHSNDDERGPALAQLLYILLNSSASPLTLSDRIRLEEEGQACNAVRALMFRVQMLCCKETEDQSSAGWRVMSVIFKYATQKKSVKLITTLTLQPWMHTLIRYQTAKSYTPEFLSFARTWLNFFRITFDQNQNKNKKLLLHKHSLLYGTLVSLRGKINSSDDGSYSDIKDDILSISDYFLNADI
ncbi:hypothetical protein EVAR_77275_1 [Eumeta japonica]|uniref:Uncharacterized protein n=1 Tax=Eumeta variegata TaxID=151549 RepID=A0A4C1ULD4_EUMVA|nr:hypothetical protein EVAR_77275_1 [Eumeta japonica]